MKKILTLIICLLLACSFIKVSANHEGMSEKDLLEDVDKNIDTLIKTTSKVEEVAKTAATLKEVQTTFQAFMTNVRYAANVLSLINGTVNFLKLIGVIKDQTKSDINDIRAQLQAINERLEEMDQKLNNITNQMAEIESDVEFSSRTEKAILLESAWNDFNYRYLENGLDKLMDDYDAMLLNGMRDWFKGVNRNYQDIDNETITVIYNNNELVHNLDNNLPTNQSYIKLTADLIPATLSWNVDSYGSDLMNALRTNISDALKKKEYNKFITNVDLSTYTSADIEKLASDAVNTLIYRVISTKLNEDASFTKDVIRTYNNYCNHLAGVDEGLDAIIKTCYFTHAFEYEVSDDITNLCNRMALKNGVYGLFVANVLGQSLTATADNKFDALYSFNESMKYINKMLANSLTGYHDYSYITNSRIRLTMVDFEGSMTVKLKLANREKSYEQLWSDHLHATLHESTEGTKLIGESKMLLLEKVLNANGQAVTYKYFKDHDLAPLTFDYDYIVTSYNNRSTFNFDGTTLYVENLAGDYFNKQYISKLPGDADNDYMALREKIMGSYYDPETHELKVNQTLSAMAVYAEDHWYWKIAEVALMGGSVGKSYFGGGENAIDSRYHTYTLSISNHFNALVTMPIVSLTHLGYSSLDSYNEYCASIEAIDEPIIIESNPMDNALTYILVASTSLFIVSVSVMGIINLKKED